MGKSTYCEPLRPSRCTCEPRRLTQWIDRTHQVQLCHVSENWRGGESVEADQPPRTLWAGRGTLRIGGYAGLVGASVARASFDIPRARFFAPGTGGYYNKLQISLPLSCSHQRTTLIPPTWDPRPSPSCQRCPVLQSRVSVALA